MSRCFQMDCGSTGPSPSRGDRLPKLQETYLMGHRAHTHDTKRLVSFQELSETTRKSCVQQDSDRSSEFPRFAPLCRLTSLREGSKFPPSERHSGGDDQNTSIQDAVQNRDSSDPRRTRVVDSSAAIEETQERWRSRTAGISIQNPWPFLETQVTKFSARKRARFSLRYVGH